MGDRGGEGEAMMMVMVVVMMMIDDDDAQITQARVATITTKQTTNQNTSAQFGWGGWQGPPQGVERAKTRKPS